MPARVRLAWSGDVAGINATPSDFRKSCPVSWTVRSRANRSGLSTMMQRMPSPAIRSSIALKPGRISSRTRRLLYWCARLLGAIAQFEKTSLVAKLKAARDRKIAAGLKCGGRKSHNELRPDVVALAKKLRRKRPKAGQRSLRKIAAELAKRGHLSHSGKPFTARSVNNMLRT